MWDIKIIRFPQSHQQGEGQEGWGDSNTHQTWSDYTRGGHQLFILKISLWNCLQVSLLCCVRDGSECDLWSEAGAAVSDIMLADTPVLSAPPPSPLSTPQSLWAGILFYPRPHPVPPPSSLTAGGWGREGDHTAAPARRGGSQGCILKRNVGDWSCTLCPEIHTDSSGQHEGEEGTFGEIGHRAPVHVMPNNVRFREHISCSRYNYQRLSRLRQGQGGGFHKD